MFILGRGDKMGGTLDPKEVEIDIKEMQIRNILTRYKFLNAREIDQITKAILELFKDSIGRKGEQ